LKLQLRIRSTSVSPVLNLDEVFGSTPGGIPGAMSPGQFERCVMIENVRAHPYTRAVKLDFGIFEPASGLSSRDQGNG
jgi:hypothetical protein